MKISKLVASLVLMGCSMLTAQAVTVQKVFLKNGSVLSGYIQQQDNDENIIFKSDNALICVDGKNVTTSDQVYKVKDLDKNWVEWAEKNDAFVGSGDGRTLTLNEVSFVKSTTATKDNGAAFEYGFKIMAATVSKVKVLEKGSTVKYVELSPNIYTLKWADVEKIVSEKRSREMLSGIDRVYQLSNGMELRGQYAGETYSTLSLYTNGAVIETFDIDNVKRCTYSGINPNQTLFEQSELLDVVRTKANGTFKGIIIERNFIEKEAFVVIQQESGTTRVIKFDEILDINCEENAAYDPKNDIILKDGEIKINRSDVVVVDVKKNGARLELEKINTDLAFPLEGETTKVVVEYSNPQHLSSEHLMMLKVDKSFDKKQNAVYSFTTDIFEMKKFMPVKVETSVNNTTRLEYNLSGKGVFAIYDQNTKKAIPFVIRIFDGK